MVDLSIKEKKYGPFTVEFPNLNEDNMLKFLMYTLWKNKFTMLSEEYIDSISWWYCYSIP